MTTPSLPQNITVLMGGPSAEREVSLRSGKAAAQALREAGFDVEECVIDSETFSLPPSTEMVFLALHGTFGEDGTVQKLLRNMRVPFTGADEESSRLAIDKELTKDQFRKHGVPTPPGQLVTRAEEITLPFPLFIKPNAQGSSVGSGKVLDKESLASVLQNALDFGQPALVERLIDGKELTVGILDNQALPIVEIVPQQGFYDYQNKYTPGNTVYHCPARISEEVAKRVQELALEAHRSIGSPVYSRVDFLLENDTDPYCLEVNTIPGMTGTSLLPKSAAAAGISFPELCKKIVVLSWERHLQQLEATPEPALLKPERQEAKTQ